MVIFGLTLPALLYGTAIATLLGALLHFWRGGNWKVLVLYIGTSWFGFWLGHFAGQALNWSFLQVGPLKLGMALIGAFLALGFVFWLIFTDLQANQGKKDG